MLGSKTKRLLISMLLGLSIFGVGYKTVNDIKANKEKREYSQSIIISDKVKVASKESIVEAVQSVSKLKMLEVQTSKTSKIQTGNVFKKTQELKFRLVHEYFLDFGSVAFDNVIISNSDIKIFMKAIEVNTSFVESATEYGKVEKGLLTFGDIKITPEEMESIKAEIKRDSNAEAKSSEEYVQAKDKAQAAIEDIILRITKLKYNVRIVFVE